MRRRYPENPKWWYRWWMYPRDHRRRFIGSGNSWEFRLWLWANHQLSRVMPGWCTSCPGRNYTHKMSCPKLRGVKGVRLWSQDG